MRQPREIAARLLLQAEDRQATLDQLLDAADHHIRPLGRPDRSLLHALVYGVLRWQGRLDWVIDHLAARSPKKIDPQVRIILRLGVYQLLFMDRIPPSAAVNTSVELTRALKRKWASGFVNALLRGVIRRGSEIPLPDRRKDPVSYLAAAHAFPNWLVARWAQRWGLEGVEGLCRAINQIPDVTLRANTLRLSRPELVQRVESDARECRRAAHSPEGIHLTSLRRPIKDWPAYADGCFQVQSEASQLISHLLAPQPGERVWDACAGLGTKTGHMAQLMENRGEILASDLRNAKLLELDRDMARLNIDIVKTQSLDLSGLPSDFAPQKFDRILLDAPCTGLGVLQRNPDGKWRAAPEDIPASGLRQEALLTAVARHLRPGGVMVYAVCSTEPEENEMVVGRFLQKHPEFGIYRHGSRTPAIVDKLRTSGDFFRTTPHQHGMDGFFAAALTRPGGIP